jgi:hypothetical protein
MYAAYLYVLRAALRDQPGLPQSEPGEQFPEAPPPTAGSRGHQRVLGPLWDGAAALLARGRAAPRRAIPAARTGR